MNRHQNEKKINTQSALTAAILPARSDTRRSQLPQSANATQTIARRTEKHVGKNRRNQSCVSVLCSHYKQYKYSNQAAVLFINLTNTHTYNCTLSNVLRLNVKIRYFSRYAEKRTNPAGAHTRRKHVALRACVCVLCSHDAVCCAPAGFERTGRTEKKSANISKTTRRLYENSSGAVGHAPFTIFI